MKNWKFYLYAAWIIFSVGLLVYSFTLPVPKTPPAQNIMINGTTYVATPIISVQAWLIMFYTWLGCVGILFGSIFLLGAWFEE